MLAQFHADDFAKRQFGGKQQRATFSGAHVNEAESFHATARGERIDPAAAHLAENRRRHGGISGEVSVVRMAGDEVALAEISGRVDAMPLIEGMFYEAKRQCGADGSDRSHRNMSGMSVTRVDFVRAKSRCDV